jgi:hypothetical protein
MRIPLPLPQRAYLQDHRFDNHPVLPAVEAMELLAGAVATHAPGVDIGIIQEARFDKFLALDPSGEITLWAELAAEAGGSIRAACAIKAALKSKRRGKRGIARTFTHADMRFGAADKVRPTDDTVAEQRTEATTVDFVPPSPQRIYTELVPFGPSYHTIESLTEVGPAGIRARLCAPAIEGALRLGSPFVLDAAFHAACVWGQRFAGLVAFPVGMGERLICHPCEAGHIYEAQIGVRERHPERLVFDIRITLEGRLCEVVRSVLMRDVSGGRLKPPDWLRPQTKG